MNHISEFYGDLGEINRSLITLRDSEKDSKEAEYIDSTVKTLTLYQDKLNRARDDESVDVAARTLAVLSSVNKGVIDSGGRWLVERSDIADRITKLANKAFEERKNLLSI